MLTGSFDGSAREWVDVQPLGNCCGTVCDGLGCTNYSKKFRSNALYHQQNHTMPIKAKRTSNVDVDKKPPRFLHFDGLRGAAALAVVVHHAVNCVDFAFYSGNRDHSRNDWDLVVAKMPYQPGNWGNLAVCLFFLISGFVLATSYSRTSLSLPATVVKRYVRLTVPILIACLLSFGLKLTGPGFIDSYQALLQNPNISLFPELSFKSALFQGVSSLVKFTPAPHSYIPVLWTMPIEFGGSLLLACALWLVTSRNWRIVILLLLAATLSFSYLSLFAIGAALYFWAPMGFEFIQKRRSIAFSILFLGLTCGTFPHALIGDSYIIDPSSFAGRRLFPLSLDAAIHSVGAIAVFVTIASHATLRDFFVTRTLQWLGAISFPLYLLHVPLMAIFLCGPFVALSALGLSQTASGFMSIMVFTGICLLASHILRPWMEDTAILASNWTGRLIDRIVRLVLSYAPRPIRSAIVKKNNGPVGSLHD